MANVRQIAAVSAYVDAEVAAADQREVAAVSAYIDALVATSNRREIAAVSVYICEVEPVPSALTCYGVAFQDEDGNTTTVDITAAPGDRSAWDVDDHADLHAKDISDALPVYHLPTADRTPNDITYWDGGKWATTAATTTSFIALSSYDAVPSRGSESNIHGGLLSLATGQPLDSVPTDLVVTKGIGKLIAVVNAGSDLSGTITITGTSVDRNTGVTTASDTDTITVDALTTDSSTTDSNGNTVHVFTGAYISSKWFTGTVTLSTADLTLTDVDVYHVSFEQFNDQPDLVLNTFDVNLFTTNVAAEFDAYLHTLHVTGSKCNVDNEASLHVGADGETAIANKYWRLRRGNIDEDLDGTTDGFWIDVHYTNSPVYVEDVTIKVWASRAYPLTVS